MYGVSYCSQGNIHLVLTKLIMIMFQYTHTIFVDFFIVYVWKGCKKKLVNLFAFLQNYKVCLWIVPFYMYEWIQPKLLPKIGLVTFEVLELWCISTFFWSFDIPLEVLIFKFINQQHLCSFNIHYRDQAHVCIPSVAFTPSVTEWKIRKLFTDPMHKLYSGFTVISYVYRSFIPNKITLINCLTQWISKFPGSFEIHWVRQYLVNFTGVGGIINTIVYKTELIFTGVGHGELS